MNRTPPELAALARLLDEATELPVPQQELSRICAARMARILGSPFDDAA